jgi:hypothetical protein
MPDWKSLVCGNRWSGESNTCPLCSKYQPHEISCPTCGNITDANLPVCLRCERYRVECHAQSGDILVVTYKKVRP